MNVLQAIGNTPLLKINEHVYAKLETLNPSGSIKDRIAKYIIEKAMERGDLNAGDTMVEATSGNTGIGFSMVAAVLGLNMVVVMPCNMSEERKQMIKCFGAKIVEVGKGDFVGAAKKAHEIAQENDYFEPLQFQNQENTQCHYEMTAGEILEQLPSNIQIGAVVAGTGTGGTLMGVGQRMKEKFTDVKIIGVEPTESAVMRGEAPGDHNIQGIGDGFIPDLVNMNKVDEVMIVSTEEAMHETHNLAKKHGIFVGISSGANILCAKKAAKKYGDIITFLPDRGERYLSILACSKGE